MQRVGHGTKGEGIILLTSSTAKSCFCALATKFVCGLYSDQSLYFSVITGTTIGFGDYSPQTPGVKLACCLLLPFMVAVLGEVLARIASTWMSRKSQEAEEKFCRRSLTLADLETMDTDHDGVVKKGEFLAYMLVALQKVSKEDVDHITQLFYRLDATKDGFLTKDDLRTRGWDQMFQESLSVRHPVVHPTVVAMGTRQ